MTRARAAAPVLPADRVDAWRLARQHLDLGTPAEGPEAVAQALVGVQAQVLSSAALSIALRSAGDVAATPRALAERRLVRSWAMRGTLHLFGADDFPVVVGALHHRETWRSPAWLRYFEVTEVQMEAIIAAVAEVLDDGRPRTRSELAADVSARLGVDIGDRIGSSWGTFLKPAANRGYLVQATADASGVTFTRPDRWLRAWRRVEPDVGLADLLQRYLAVYGPASMAEILRWWGAQRTTDVRRVFGSLGGAIVEVDVEGVRGFVRAVDVPAIEATSALAGSVRLLGPFDPLVVGAGLRERLIPAAHLKRVSRTAGWISPVVLIDGRVGGVWSHARAGSRLRFTVDPFEPPDAAIRRAIDRAAANVAGVHGAEAEVRYGRVHAMPEPAADD